MAGLHTMELTVPREAIDANGHVNNLEYLRWMQDIAVAHSAARGWDVERYQAEGGTWVARSHYIEYLGAAFEGDVLAVHTWVEEPGSSSWWRQYAIVRGGSGPAEPEGARSRHEVIARAETLWVFVDLHSGRARRIPEGLRAAFEPASAEALRQLGVAPSLDGRGKSRRR